MSNCISFACLRGKANWSDTTGRPLRGRLPGRYTVAPLLPANTRILAALALPPVYGITCAGDVGEDAFLRSAERALEGGLRLIQLREKDWPLARRDALAEQLVPLAHRFGAQVLLNGIAGGCAAPRVRRRALDIRRAGAGIAAADRHAGRCVVPYPCRRCARGRARSRLRRAGTCGADADASGGRAAGVGWFRGNGGGRAPPGLRAGRIARRRPRPGYGLRRAGGCIAPRGVAIALGVVGRRFGVEIVRWVDRGDAVSAAGPRALVDGPAALRAERPPGRRRTPCHERAALRAWDDPGRVRAHVQ